MEKIGNNTDYWTSSESMREKNEPKLHKNEPKESRKKGKRNKNARGIDIHKTLEKKNELNAIIDSIGDGIIAQDTDFRIIYQNQIQNDLFGNHIGEYCYKAYEGRDTVCEDCPVELTFMDGKIHKAERCVPTESGISYFELTSSPLRDSAGKIIAGIKVVRDITSTRLAEEAVRRSEDKYRSLFETMAQGVVYQDSGGKIISANPAAERILGLTFEQMQGRTSVDPRWKAVHDDGSGFLGEQHPSMMALKTGREVRDVVIGVYNPEIERYRWINVNAIPQFRSGEAKPDQVYTTFEDITELKQAEKLVRESEEKYRNLVELTTDVIYISDRQGNHVFMNDAGCLTLEALPEEVLGKHWSNWIHPEDIERSFEKFKEMMEQGINVFSFENRYQSKSGRVINVLHNVRVIRNERGEIVGAQGIARDITKRKQAEEALKESEKKYRMLVENIHDGVFIIQDAKIQFVNDAIARMSGYAVEEVIGKSFHDFVAPEDLEIVTDRYHRRQAGEELPEEYEFNMLHKDGKTRILVNMKMKIISYRGRVASMGTLMDITERKRAENELREGERFLANLFASIQDGIGIIDKDMNIIRVNPMAESWYPQAFPFAGKKCYEAFHGRSERCEICPASRTLETGESAYDVVQKHGPGGEDAGWIEIYSFPMIDTATGEMRGVIEYVRDITERKRVEKEKDKFLKAFASSTDGITIADEKDRFVYVNEAYARIFGYNQEELIGKTWHKITPPEIIAPTEKGLSNTMHNKDIGTFYGEVPGLRKDGTIIPAEVRGKGIWDENGHYQGHICVVRDITERKRAQEALQKSNSQQKAILNNIPDLAWLKDKESRFISVNVPFAEACGMNSEDLAGKTDFDIWPRELAQRYRADDIEVMETGKRKQIEEPLVNKEGKKTWVETIKTPISNDSGELIGTTGIARDITEHKRMEESLKLFSEAVENAPDGVQIIDLDGCIIYSNMAVEEIYGFSPEELQGKHVNEMNLDPEFAEKVIIPGIIKKGRWVGELLVKHKDGKVFPILLNASIVKSSKGEPIALMGIIRDITDRKRFEEAIRNYARQLEESNRIKDLFTDIMHHDLLNPLATAKGFIELLRETGTTPEKMSYIEIIERSLNKSMELIDSATMFSKIESMKSIEFEDFDLTKLMGEVIANFDDAAIKKGTRIENSLDQSMPVRANKIIEEVFVNLISNAIKYAPDGKIVVSGEDMGESWRIKVIDFGEGIKDKDKALIFEKFRRKEKKGVKGSGLGLAIARKVVELHKGRIMVEDNPEGGTVFIVEIPKYLQ